MPENELMERRAVWMAAGPNRRRLAHLAVDIGGGRANW